MLYIKFNAVASLSNHTPDGATVVSNHTVDGATTAGGLTDVSVLMIISAC